MEQEDRRDIIMTRLRAEGRVTVNDLSAMLGISKETIRRDLTVLETMRRLRKVHGGAALPEPGIYEFSPESPFQARMEQNGEAKRGMARAAATLLKAGDVLFVDTGTTTVVFAEELSRLAGLTVITNSGLIAGLAARAPEARVVHIGGDFRLDGAETLGPTAIEQIGRYQASHAFITVAGLTELGGQDYDSAEADVARAMIGRAQKVVVMADGTKFFRGAPYTAVDMARIDVLVTDRMPEGSLLEALNRAEARIIVR